MITSESSRDYIRKLLTTPTTMTVEKQLILIGRTAAPHWLGLESIARRYLIAAEPDLYFGAEVVAQTRLDLYRYLVTAFYEQWDSEVKRAMLPLSTFDSFTLHMAELVTGSQSPQRLIERAMAVSEFLQTDGAGTYRMRSVLREYLCYKQQTDLTKAQRDNIYQSAGLYYELDNDIEKALECYNKSGNQDKIAELLIRNTSRHVGIAHYYKTRNYYFALQGEQVKQSPALMTGMSLLCSLMMRTEENLTLRMPVPTPSWSVQNR